MTPPGRPAVPGRSEQPEFAARPPSQGWESIALPGSSQCRAWAWFKPPQAPHGLILRIPEETYRQSPRPEGLTLRALLQAAGVDPAGVVMWQLYGYGYDAQGGTSPLLDQAVPPPPPGVDPNIFVSLHPAAAGAAFARPNSAAGVPPAGTSVAAPAPMGLPIAAPALDPGQVDAPAAEVSAAELFDRIETDWQATLQLEKDLIRLRKQLVDLSNRLKTLNRDLTAQERVHSNTQDKKDWQDARRWLRDASTMLSVSVREHDIGDTSAAGQRHWFEQLYQQYVLPRQPFDGLLQAQRDFETYRKSVQKLHNSMNSVYANASLNGERRAQQVLNRIQAKVREATIRKNMLGIMLD